MVFFVGVFDLLGGFDLFVFDLLEFNTNYNLSSIFGVFFIIILLFDHYVLKYNQKKGVYTIILNITFTRF